MSCWLSHEPVLYGLVSCTCVSDPFFRQIVLASIFSEPQGEFALHFFVANVRHCITLVWQLV